MYSYSTCIASTCIASTYTATCTASTYSYSTCIISTSTATCTASTCTAIIFFVYIYIQCILPFNKECSENFKTPL